MKILRQLDRTGDSVIEFDETEAKAEDKAKAKQVFNDWMAKNRTAFLTNRTNKQPDMKLTSFDQIEDGAEALLIPKIVAG